MRKSVSAVFQSDQFSVCHRINQSVRFEQLDDPTQVELPLVERKPLRIMVSAEPDSSVVLNVSR